MSGPSAELARDYGSALRAYLQGGGEAELKRAYDLGRLAMNEETGLLAMVLLHRQALEAAIRKARASSRNRSVARAMEFLAESLAPFEMAHRGFQDAYARLRELTGEYEMVIAERVRELRNAEARYRAHVELIPAVTYIESLKTGDTVYISPQVEAMLGFTPQEWLDDPRRWSKQIHPDDRERILEAMSRLRSGDGDLRAEYRLLTRGGREVPVRHEAGLVRDESGKPQFIQGILLEMSLRKRN
ncbi:MAG TPA: PAS domain-containing protein [Planctomycetota bacterium]